MGLSEPSPVPRGVLRVLSPLSCMFCLLFKLYVSIEEVAKTTKLLTEKHVTIYSGVSLDPDAVLSRPGPMTDKLLRITF